MKERAITVLFFVTCALICIIGALILNDKYIQNEINDIRQEITELRKDFSYDPKDAK